MNFNSLILILTIGGVRLSIIGDSDRPHVTYATNDAIEALPDDMHRILNQAISYDHQARLLAMVRSEGTDIFDIPNGDDIPPF